MKPRLLDFLVCPLYGDRLHLVEWEGEETPLSPEHTAKAKALGIDPVSLSREVVTGLLVNRARNVAYPIHGGVPRMLVFRTGLTEDFLARHGDRMRRELPGVDLPDATAPEGEREVLRTFSQEWTSYDWDGEAYWNLDPDTWFKCMRFVLELDTKPVRRGSVLEVGVGVGGVADYVSRNEEAEVVGIDLGYAVDVAHRHFGSNPFLHVVQGSAFAPPFPAQRFDFVYSFGVIHHTYSTKTAFESLARLPKKDGRLYIWVYSPWHEQRTLVRRAIMALERVARPVVSRLPDSAQTVALAPVVPLYMAYQLARSVRRGQGQVKYDVRRALHAARDRFTPRYIHRHTEDEVCGWFQQAGYGALSRGSDHDRPEWVPIAFTACTGVSGKRLE